MSRKTALAVATVALLGSTAFAYAQDTVAQNTVAQNTVAQNTVSDPTFVLSATGGVQAFQVPAFDTGAFGHSSSGGTLLGGMLGVSATRQLAPLGGGWDFIGSASIFGMFATGTTVSETDTFTGPGTVTVTGLSGGPTTAGGADTITSTVSAGSTNVQITANNPEGGGSTQNSTVGAGSDAGFASPSSSGSGFSMGGASNNGTTGIGAGGIADSSGGVFYAAGSDLDGLTISTSVTQSIAYGGADLSLGVSGVINSRTQVQLYGGPSVRVLSQTNTTNITADIPEVGTAITIPEFKVSAVDDLLNTYLGASVGGNISFAAQKGVVVSLGAEGAVYYLNSSWSGHDTYSTCCGTGGTSSPTLSTDSDAGSYNFPDSTAYAARGHGSVSFGIGNNQALTLGANVEYLSRVAQVNHSNLTSTTTSYTSPESWTNGSGPTPSTTYSWSSMFNYGISATLSGSF